MIFFEFILLKKDKVGVLKAIFIQKIPNFRLRFLQLVTFFHFYSWKPNDF